jgi:uncharacterized protein
LGLEFGDPFLDHAYGGVYVVERRDLGSGFWHVDSWASGILAQAVGLENGKVKMENWKRGDVMEPTYGNGKICYIEMPSVDLQQSAEFYRKVFGWRVRTREDGSTAFDDGVEQVSGTWVLGRKAFEGTGLTVHIMVDDIEAAMELVKANGGTILQGVGAHAPEITATFCDPSGNVFGLYQHRG